MLLSARMLDDVGGVNTFKVVSAVHSTQGEAITVYFQLIDASKDQDHLPPGRRYAPVSGATLSVVLGSIDDAKKVTRSATQPYTQDPSIWSLSLLASDELKGNLDLKLRLTESGATKTGYVRMALAITPTDLGF